MTMTVDGSGRVVIPKSLRDKFGLHAGTTVEILETPEGLVLKPAERKSSLARKGRFLVYVGKVPNGFDVVKAVEDEREAQDRKNLGH
jgi:AbrB family looped-hinge helix DNA binding protein